MNIDSEVPELVSLSGKTQVNIDSVRELITRGTCLIDDELVETPYTIVTQHNAR